MSSNNSDNSIKFDKNFIIKLKDENNKIIIDKNEKEICKILQISSKLDIDKKLKIINTLEPSEYPHLFIFIIEEQNLNFLSENQDVFEKFGASRRLIIHQICDAENKTKFYYKDEHSSAIEDIDQHFVEDYEEYGKWKHILSSLERELQPFEDKLLKKLSYIEDSSIILRFLRTLNLSESFFETLVKFIAESGSKADLLAILDASYEENGRILNNQAQNYIKNVFEDDESRSESDKVESDLEQLSDEQLDGTSIKNEDSSQSVLLTAVQNSNLEIIDYLITYWTPLIQQLPVEHQIRISSTAYNGNQLNVLCDLLEFSDFPFPGDFNIKNCQRLQKIITDRIKFHEAIEEENYEEINDFIEKNLSLKFIYCPQNITAMKKAIDSQKYKIYYYFKSFGLCASEFSNLEEVLDKRELKKANADANIQKTESISEALRNAGKSVLILCTRALIHNRKVKKEDETKYHKNIKKWLEDVNKIASIMLDVAASCDNLVIIFDFESKFVDRTAFRDSALGLSSDTVSSRIFIGAKLGDSKREQEIKGVLAHELCHYVMSLVYDNKFLPYYKHDLDIRDKFDRIVKSIDKWSSNDPEQPDDECNGIISTVFRYKKEQFNLEMIVRSVHILVLYDDDPRKSQHLQEKYQNLFEFWFNHVIPELHKYLQKNKVVIRINATVELLSSLSKWSIEFKALKDMEQLTKNRIIIVNTNVPKLLLINIYKYLHENLGCLFDSQNVFIEPEKIKNKQVWKDLMHLYAKDVKLNIFVDCTKGFLDNLSRLLKIDEFRFILVASNEEQLTRLNDICVKKEINPTVVDIKYNWSDLTEETQIELLHFTVTFQNNSSISIIELLSKNMNSDQNEINNYFSSIINDHVFNQIIECQEIKINSNIEDSKKNEFYLLFQNRHFLKKGINYKNDEISQENLISITANNKHVLISDIAGSGKSWVVKNISKIIRRQNPTRWVTYVDLKQFIQEFKKQPENLEFADYFIENILKSKTKFEEEIFKKLYKNGKVSIIFDAFDEIAPDCAEFVADFAKTFEFNDGNQLWIVTREYFEVNLQDKLGIGNVYKLSDFTEEDGVNFIAAYWNFIDNQTINNMNDYMQNISKSLNYRIQAEKIVHKIATSKRRAIGLPQLFSMIADGFKDDKDMVGDLKGAKLFTQFVSTMYTRWADFKGILRKQACIQSLDYEMNFKELHQYLAILSLFPELVDILFPDYDISEWPEVEIIAGGLLNKIGSSYSFIHETFREYFVADFIFKAIKKPRIKKTIFIILIKILTIRKFGIIRMFLNDLIDNSSIMEKVQLELEKNVEKFNELEDFSNYFTENLEHLAPYVIEVLKKGDYKRVREILNNNISNVARNTKELKIFTSFTEFLFSYLKDEDLKQMINRQYILHKVIGADSSEEIFEYFIIKLDAKFGREFIQQELKLMPSGPENGNIFYHLGTSEYLRKEKVQKCFELFQKYLSDNEIIELIDKCTEDGQTILEILITNSTNFKPFLEGSKCIFTNQNMLKKFKNIICKIDSNGQNILHLSADKKSIEFHTSVWKVIRKTFKNQAELGTFVLQKNKLKYNFLHDLINQNKSETIEFTLKKLKENLSELDYHEILTSKGEFERNLLQHAAVNSKEVKTHQILWKNLRDSCKSHEEFLEIFGQVDEQANDVFNLAASFTTAEVFEFIEGELEKIASHNEIRKFFTKLGLGDQNLLQAAGRQNQSLELHKKLWKIIQTYFTSTEILKFVKNLDIYGDNLLIDVIEENTKEVAELTWKEVKELLNSIDLITDEHKENIEKCENITKIISGPNQLQNDDREILKLKWIKSEEKNLNVDKFDNLELFTTDENIKNHEKLWENLVGIYKTSANLKKLLSEKVKNGNNIIHLLVAYNTADVIEFTIQKLKEHLSEPDFHEILTSKGQFGRNLLQIAIVHSKEIKTHQILWKTFRDSCKSHEEFFEILVQVDDQENDVFNLAASFTTNDIFEFIERELVKIAPHFEIRKFFSKLGLRDQNLLQSASRQNKSSELHKKLWKIIQKYFNPSEILEFVTHRNKEGDNLLIISKNWSTIEILELTWMEVEKVLTYLYTDTETVQNIKQCGQIVQKIAKLEDKEDEIDLLNLNWIKQSDPESSNLFDESTNDSINRLHIRTVDNLIPMIKNENVAYHEIYWKVLLISFESLQNLAKLLLEKAENGFNFLHNLVIFNTADVIEFTLQELNENLNESDYQKVLRSKGKFGRNLLHVAVWTSKEVKTHEILWKTIQRSCKSDKCFLEFLGNVDDDGNNVISLATAFTSGEIFKFMQKELEKIALPEEIKKLLTILGSARRNMLQSAVFQNESLELHEALWEVLEKYFNSSEILQFSKHCDVYGWNVLLYIIEKNTKEVKELTWSKVRKALITNGFEKNVNFKICEEIIKTKSNLNELTKEEEEILKLDWIESTNSVKLFKDSNLKVNLFLKDLMMFVVVENIENHECSWKYLEETFKNYEELKKLLFRNDEYGNNLIHLLVVYNTADVIEFTIQKLKENLNESDYQEILTSKGQFERNLLQIAIVYSKEIKTHQILWKTFRDSCKSDEEFLEKLVQIDEEGNDVFNLAAFFTTSDIFEFMEGELEKIASHYQIRKILIKLGLENRNLLQTASRQKKSLEFHKTLWKIIQKYFNPSEILDFVRHLDLNGHNLLIIAKHWSTIEIFELTWMEVEKVLANLYTDNETVQMIKEYEQKIAKFEDKEEEIELLKLNWIIQSNPDQSNLFDESTQSILRKSLIVQTLNDLTPMIINTNVLNHEILWEHLLKTFENRQDLVKLLFEENQNGKNFIQLLVIYNTADVIEFTLNELIENLNESDFHEVLISKGHAGQNLLQIAAVYTKKVKIYQILWNIFENSCQSDEEFSEKLEKFENIVENVATFSTGKIFKFIQKELEKIAHSEVIKKLLINLGFARRSILQSGAQQNASLDLHEVLWEILEKYFNSSEILQFIKHRDVYGWNVLLNVFIRNTREVKKLTWNKVRKILITIGCEDNDNFKQCDEIMKNKSILNELTKEEKEVLKLSWIDSTNSVQLFKDNIQLLKEKKASDMTLEDLMMFMADENVENHEFLWKYLEETFKNYEELKKLLFRNDEYGNNFVHLLVAYNTDDVIEFTIQKLKENLNESDNHEILTSKGQFGRNLLHFAALTAKESKTYQLLWKLIQSSCKSNEEFFEILVQVDEYENNAFNLAAAVTTSEVLEFMISEMEKLINEKPIKRKLLTSFGKAKTNLLQSVATDNKSLETNKIVWKIICNYFDSKEILEFIEYCDRDGDNLLCNVVFWNTRKIVEFTWNQIKIYVSTKDAQAEYLNRKGHKGKSLNQLSLENQAKDPLVADWVQQTMREFEIQ